MAFQGELEQVNRTILVTGGAGFIGNTLVRQLVYETDYTIVNFDKLTYAGNRDSLFDVESSPRYRFEHADVADITAVRRILQTHRPTAVIHLAAESHVDRSIDGPADFLQTNVVGTYTLLEGVREYWSGLPDQERTRFRFHHVSTDEVFGSLGSMGYFTEDTPYRPNSPYSATKAASDHLVRAWHHTYGLPTIVTNCSNNYGPFQFPEKLIPLMILTALEERALPVYGDGLNVRDWLYVEDHCRALRCVLERGRVGETYNIGGHNEKTNLEVVQTICSLLDELRPRSGGNSYADLMTFVQDRPGHDRRYAIDATKIDRELGWRPQESFESGLQRTVEWYLDNPVWCTRAREGTYRLERLGVLA